ncbi:MAG: hypothetical protein Q7J57_00510 [Gemmobacter sp.]|nr:hypothetical protein [Gemmobacter sp.]
MLILWFSVDLRMMPASGCRGAALALLFSGGLGGSGTAFRHVILTSVSLLFALVAVNAG